MEVHDPLHAVCPLSSARPKGVRWASTGRPASLTATVGQTFSIIDPAREERRRMLRSLITHQLLNQDEDGTSATSAAAAAAVSMPQAS